MSILLTRKNYKTKYLARHWWLMPVISGGRDQEDGGLKPIFANSSRDPILKKTHHKKGIMERLKV
jgi:hypothetical protein